MRSTGEPADGECSAFSLQDAGFFFFASDVFEANALSAIFYFTFKEEVKSIAMHELLIWQEGANSMIFLQEAD
jgi:hypothetical protein